MPLKKSFLLVLLLLLSITAPVLAHDLPMGASRWSFGNSTILGFIDLKPSLFSEIKPIKDGHYNPETASSEQLQQIATEILQPYVSQKLAIEVNHKLYPIKVDRLLRGDNDMYTICLSVDHVSFNQPVNDVKIAYSLLRDETNNEHISLAFGYVTDATGDALQRVFNISPPAFQGTFDANNRVWELSVKGSANAPAAEPKAEGQVVTASPKSIPPAGRSQSVKNPAAQKNFANTLPAPGLASADAPNTPKADNPIVSSSVPVVETSPDSQGASLVSPNTGKPSIWNTARLFIPLGIEHILTGYDHIAFLLGIIVIELSIRQILKIITAFTVAHSITLLLAALQIVKVNSALVESVIAFSICYVALENMFKKKTDYRWLITFGFGLIHGFGFASALRELIVGRSNLLLSVLCFNMGVEMGQLMLFFVMLPILYLLKKQIGFRLVTVSTSLIVFAVGFAWLMERVFHLKLLWF